jgi:PAS domain S-box-containing protein
VPGLAAGSVRRRAALLLAETVGVAALAVALGLVLLYHATVEGRLRSLAALAERREMVIRAVAAETGSIDAAIDRLWSPLVRRAERAMPEEIVIAARAGDAVEYHVRSHEPDGGAPLSVPARSPRGEPIRRALGGESGGMRGVDEQGERVLAAYRPIAGTRWGIVAQVHLAEVRAPFYRAAGIAAGAIVLLALAGTWGVRRVTEPLLARIERSERRFRELSRHSSDIVLLLDREGRIRWVSPAVEAVLGRLPGELEGLPLPDVVHPVDRESVRRAIAEGFAPPERPRRLDLRLARGDGSWRRIEALGSDLLDVEEVGALVVNARDVTDRHAAEERAARLDRVLRTSAEVGEAALRASDEAALLAEACRITVETGGYLLAWVGWKDAAKPGLVRAAAVSGGARGYDSAITVRWDDTPLGNGPTGRAIRLGRPAAVADVETDLVLAPWRARLQALGARSMAALPIRVAGEVEGALAVYSSQPGEFDDERLAALGEVAENLGRGIRGLRLRAERPPAEGAAPR